MTVQQWIDAHVQAWEDADAEAAAALFTEDGVYRSHRFGEPHLGREGVAGYWREVTSTQTDVHVRFGRPVLEGSRAAVEWWTTLVNSGSPVTLAGCLFLPFDAEGRCEELRECWHVDEGMKEPPAGWGR